MDSVNVSVTDSVLKGHLVAGFGTEVSLCIFLKRTVRKTSVCFLVCVSCVSVVRIPVGNLP